MCPYIVQAFESADFEYGSSATIVCWKIDFAHKISLFGNLEYRFTVANSNDSKYDLIFSNKVTDCKIWHYYKCNDTVSVIHAVILENEERCRNEHCMGNLQLGKGLQKLYSLCVMRLPRHDLIGSVFMTKWRILSQVWSVCGNLPGLGIQLSTWSIFK